MTGPKIKINITVDDKVLERFKELCKERGMKVSTRLEWFMKKELNETEEKRR